ncbi:hypothetical protein PO027_11495 [Bacteroides thetaiotaomicron]|uniref:hypothetical protein n=1 Tax=Bacteroides thetaiotaomicron TaxID=818 RepID=UPI00232DB714|nr:hypothetical protein [Bacteroides thetaiotaomicron]MDC2006890.1 hypothetical protein [Bacteroides thetaiotaomicron]MDC2021946.1 hypothetical protein [Bacteroides thetaiotaomicron]MDC2027526.1 hypothetical protein [Bacteroides thetaiotaomicron]MDC2030740.1 hypothetical protein [Bacteroides thetaiotaomicron]MDC2061773.1 hypothetical protein [Bacteroides thetaiotaomicron]
MWSSARRPGRTVPGMTGQKVTPSGCFPAGCLAATPTTAPKLLPFSAPPADCACGVPG